MGLHRCHDRIVQVDPTGQFVLWVDPRSSSSSSAAGDEDGVTNKIALAEIINVTYGE